MVRWQQLTLLVDGPPALRGADAVATIKAIDDKSAEEKKAGTKPTTRERFDSLLSGLGMTEADTKTYLGDKKIWNEGWEGFRTAAIFTDSNVKRFLLSDSDSLFKSTTEARRSAYSSKPANSSSHTARISAGRSAASLRLATASSSPPVPWISTSTPTTSFKT